MREGVGFPVCVESRVFILYVVQKPDDDLDTSPKMAASPIRERWVRLFLMATWKSGLGNDIYYIHRSVKPVKWPVADGGEEKVVFLREFF